MAGDRPCRLDPQQKTLSASEQEPAARAAWRATVDALAPNRFVFVDETSTTIALTRRYARAPRGERARGSVPRHHGTPTTLLAARSREGLGAAMTLEGAANTEAFTVYRREVRCPTLRPGQIVIVDHVSFHRAARVRALVEAAGCRLLFLPAYAPAFNPIEWRPSKDRDIGSADEILGAYHRGTPWPSARRAVPPRGAAVS